MPICANPNPWIHSRRFIDIVDIDFFQVPSLGTNTTYYTVGKLAFDLLPIVLSRITALGGSQVHESPVLLRSQPAFYLIKNDPLGLEKVTATQAIEEFLKV